MQDWDRIVMIAVGVAVSLYAARDGYRYLRMGNYLAVAGVALLTVIAITTPILLVLFAT